jgi:hypothetical protein
MQEKNHAVIGRKKLAADADLVMTFMRPGSTR